MLTLALVIALVFCAIMWVFYYVNFMMLITYMVSRNYPLPDKEDIHEQLLFVLLHFFTIRKGR